MTDPDQRTRAADPLASQRPDLLLATIEAARARIDAAMASAAGADVQFAAAMALSQLAGLEARLSSGDLTGLAQMASTASSLASAVEAKAASAGGRGTAEGAGVGASAHDTLKAVYRDVFDKKALDPYLRFSSTEDEAAYRKREEQNREAIQRELAKGTPEGDRRAAQLMSRQLDDAEAHGAGASREFAALRERTSEAAKKAADLGPDAAAKSASGDLGALPPAASTSELNDAMAALRASGVKTLEPTIGEPQHGVQIARTPSADRGALRS